MLRNHVKFIFCIILLVSWTAKLHAQELFSATGTIVELSGEDHSGIDLAPQYQLRTSQGERHLLLGADRSQLSALRGKFVEVSGFELLDAQLLVTNIVEMNLSQVQKATVSGQRRLLIVRVNFSNAQVPCDREWVSRVMWSGTLSVNGLYQASSFNNFSWSRDADGNNQDDVFEVNVGEAVPSTCSWTLLYHWRSLALQAARAQGVTVDLYQHVVYLLPNEVPCGIGHAEGAGCGDDCSAFLKLCSHPDLYAHELAHNLGLNHARTDTNNDGVLDSEYGDYSCIMGYSTVGYRHFNALHKRYLGWIPETGEVEAQSTQKYKILATEKNPSTENLAFGSTQLVRIAVPGSQNSFYYVSYRDPLDGYSEKLSDPRKVHIHRNEVGSPFSYLVTTLGAGQTFSDGNGVRVRFDSMTSPYASVFVYFGPASEIPTPEPDSPPPQATVAPISRQSVTFRILANRVSYRKIKLRLKRLASREVGTFKINRQLLVARELEPGDYQVNAIAAGLKSSRVSFTVAQEALEILVRVKK